MSSVILLGAGFSKAVFQAMPLLDELRNALKERVTVPEEVSVLGDNLEQWLSYLSLPQPWNAESANLRNKAFFWN